MNIRRPEEVLVREMLGSNDGHIAMSSAFFRGVLDELDVLRGDALGEQPDQRIEDKMYLLELAIDGLVRVIRCR